MISAIYFDFDGVLTTDKTGSLTTIRYLSTRTGIPQQELWEAFAPFNNDLLYGKTRHSQIWPDLCQRLGRELDIALLIPAFESTPMNEGMLNLARSLTVGYSVGIITDNKKDRIDCLKEHAGLDAIFSPIVVSAECGTGKEGTEIFRRALEHLGVAPDEAILIDNSKRNLVVASVHGMKTIFFDDDANDVQGLTDILRDQHGVAVLGDA